MLVKNAMIEKMFIESDLPGDPFAVSDADTMLNYINPQAKKPARVSIFTQAGCSYCANAKRLLSEHGLNYEEIVVGRDVSHQALFAITGMQTVPQVFIDAQHIGTSEDLAAYLIASKASAA